METQIQTSKVTETEEVPHSSEIEIGAWYWYVKNTDDADDDEWDNEDERGGARFVCVTHIGSNYVKVEAINGSNYWRIHFDDFDKLCKLEPDSRKIIEYNQNSIRMQIADKMNRIKQITQMLGCHTQNQIEEDTGKQETALAVITETVDPNKYKQELITAKDKTLPALFKEMKELNEEFSLWLKADTFMLEAQTTQLKSCLSVVNDRIFHVELYSGLIEQVEHINKGKTASQNDKLYIMQRRCYMDEECLIDYEAGGMDFKNISQFDKWLCKKKHLDRILPHQKCMVAFRVRRDKKQYEQANNLLDMFVQIKYHEYNDMTFLYIRNGTNVYRLNTELDFGEKLFPDSAEYDSSQKIWGEGWHHISDIITNKEYEERKAQYLKTKKEDRWRSHFRENEYHEFNTESVYYDDIKEVLETELKEYNRIVLIIQGLFDRTEILHPHRPVKLWKGEEFKDNVELVYENMGLYAGQKPDFETYREKVNKLIVKGSMITGQQDQWEIIEAEKENRRRSRDWRLSDNYRECKTFSPYGNPGPGKIAKVVNYMPRARKCTFEWDRQRQHDHSDHYWHLKSEHIKTRVTIESEHLLNVSAYKPGDYKKFFDDPRTRQEYLQWAHLLLAAEDYHGRKRKRKGKSNS